MNDRKWKKMQVKHFFYKFNMTLDDSKILAHATMGPCKDLMLASKNANAAESLKNALVGESESIAALASIG